MNKTEMETLITYNQAEPTAMIYTFDKALIGKLEKLRETDKRISLSREGDGWKEYTLPKKAVKVRMPRELSDEERAKMADRMKNIRKGE